MTNSLSKIDRFLGVALFAGALIVSLYLSHQANSDLLHGRYVLFMDEIITFDGVDRLLHPSDLNSWIDTVIDGDDHRYGRILWNASALIAAIPERLFGASGQIYATRMAQVIFQLAAYIILSLYFLKSWIVRGIGLWTLTVLPATSYYATMPKPEPILLLFFSIFLILAFKHSFKFGYYWIFFGLAFGSKISVFTSLPFIIGLSLIQQFKLNQWVSFPNICGNRNINKFLLPVVIIGFGIYEIAYGLLEYRTKIPSIENHLSKETLTTLLPILVGVFCILSPGLTHLMDKNKILRFPSTWLKTIGVFIFGFAIAVPVAVLKIPTGTSAWLQWTFLSTGHGADDSRVSILSWAEFILDDWSEVPSAILFIIFILGILLILISLIKSRLKFLANPTQYPGLVLVTLSSFSILPIIILVDRLWGFYLHIGIVFFIIGLLKIYELESYLYLKKNKSVSNIKFAVFILFIILQIAATSYMLAETKHKLTQYSQRSETYEFKSKKAEYDYLIGLFNKISIQLDRHINITYDPSLFFVSSNEKWTITLFWGFFSEWEAQHDVVVMTNKTVPTQSIDSTSASYPQLLKAKEAYEQHVTMPNFCKINPCYAEIKADIPNLRIFIRKDLSEQIYLESVE
ncbi:MAG: hypothetical protein AAGD25_10445 [Cyanobacteria bacterium P01_F01_bin.150]